MNKNKILLLGGFILFALLLNFHIAPIKANNNLDMLYSNKATSIPTIDGMFDDLSEWSDANKTSFYISNPSLGHQPGRVYVYIKNTNNKLFILIDDIPDNTSDRYDRVDINFDCNFDGITDENISMILSRDKSIDALGNSLVDWGMGFRKSVNNDTYHTILEIAIDITFDSVYDGVSKPEDLNGTLPVGTPNKSIKFTITVPPSFCNWSIPQGAISDDPTTFTTLILAGGVSEGFEIPFSGFETLTLITSIAIIGVIVIMKKRKKI